MKTILVADDLTGASDAGVQFAKRGLRTTVWLDHQRYEEVDADLVVVDMDSRATSRASAYARMRDYLAALGPLTPRRILKKMDSTLRGNAGPELRALLEALPDAFAIVCPAYPKNGRTAREGILSVNGTRVDRTDFARDLFSPVGEARIAAHLENPSVALGLETIRAGTAALNAAIDEARARGIRVAVADAETDADLRALTALDRDREDLLWVGSAGVLEMLERGAAEPGRQRGAVPPANGAVTFLIGSLSAMTQRQLDDYAAHGTGPLRRLDPLALLQGEQPVPLAAPASPDDVVVALDGDRSRVQAALAFGETHGWDVAETSRRLRAAFLEATRPLLREQHHATVVLSGGDIARAFCEAYGVRGMEILAETAPGIPVSRAIGADLFLVTKAGGFGQPETYREILATLHPQVTA
jgi:D-threonate/D-erythronate kinase